jgi:hypothetical protein
MWKKWILVNLSFQGFSSGVKAIGNLDGRSFLGEEILYY